MSLESKLARIEKQAKISFAEEPGERDLRLLELLHTLRHRRKDPEYLNKLWREKYQRDTEKIMKELETYFRAVAEGKIK